MDVKVEEEWERESHEPLGTIVPPFLPTTIGKSGDTLLSTRSHQHSLFVDDLPQRPNKAQYKHPTSSSLPSGHSELDHLSFQNFSSIASEHCTDRGFIFQCSSSYQYSQHPDLSQQANFRTVHHPSREHHFTGCS